MCRIGTSFARAANRPCVLPEPHDDVAKRSPADAGPFAPWSAALYRPVLAPPLDLAAFFIENDNEGFVDAFDAIDIVDAVTMVDAVRMVLSSSAKSTEDAADTGTIGVDPEAINDDDDNEVSWFMVFVLAVVTAKSPVM